MSDELRSHDPRPTLQESGWMRLDPFDALSRAVLMAGIAMAIGTGVGILVDEFADSASPAESDGHHNAGAANVSS